MAFRVEDNLPLSTESEQRLLGAINNTLERVGELVPVGSMQMWIGQPDGNLPTRWLVCDGSEVSRTAYKPLFDLIGIQFGDGDGETSFNLPDLRNRILMGANSGTITGNTVSLAATGSAYTGFYTTVIIRGR